MKRFEDWRPRLDAYIQSRTDMPFDWGKNDCVMFAAHGIKAITGVDLSAEYFGTYETREEAKAILAKLTGTESYADGMAKLPDVMGLLSIDNIAFAQRGDLVLIRLHEHIPALGLISMDARFAVAPGPEGLKYIPVSEVLSAWKIG